MLAIEVEFLLGRSVATVVNRRDCAEWPPHPSRLYSALVDALADVRTEEGALAARCEAALRWLENQTNPELAASFGDDVSLRSLAKFWVPINDEPAEKVRSAPLVDQRKRQERFFPTAVPSDPTVVFVWPDAEPSPDQAAAIDALVARIPYLGHSSSIVRVARRSDAPPTRLSPYGTGDEPYRLRVPGPGRLDRLDAVHGVRRKDTLVQPPIGREVVYRAKSPACPRGPLGASRVISLSGRRLSIEHFAPFLAQLRAALLSHLGDDAPPVLTGHENGQPMKRAHIGFAPLANIGHERADGTVKGVAIFLPHDMDDDDVLRLDEAIARTTLNFMGTITRPLGSANALRSLDTRRYAQSSTEWLSVTPVVLGRHPKPRKLSAEEIIASEIEQVIHVRPAEVIAQDVAFVRGAARARETIKGGVSSVRSRITRHVYLRFEEPVQGPLVIGAGRHMGFGLLVPARAPTPPGRPRIVEFNAERDDRQEMR